ncbi:MAG: hypothetical protein KY437_01335 [Actinobacteria bacterium]|nr:hypothetical protein [Actinomycetota bacterium]
MGRARPVRAARLLAAAVAAVGLVLTVTPVLGSAPASAQEACTAPSEAAEFEMAYIDETRAGGEPIIVTHPDGTLL